MKKVVHMLNHAPIAHFGFPLFMCSAPFSCSAFCPDAKVYSLYVLYYILQVNAATIAWLLFTPSVEDGIASHLSRLVPRLRN